MKKFIPLTLLTVLLASCGGGGTTPEPLNVTGNWGGSLQTTTGGGLGAVDVTLTQATSGDFTGTLSNPMFGGNHPLVGNANQGTLKSDTSNANVNANAAFSCTGTFSKSSYRGDCTMNSGGSAFVLVLARK